MDRINKFLILLIVMGLFSCTAHKKIDKLYQANENVEREVITDWKDYDLPKPLIRYFENVVLDSMIKYKSLNLRHGGSFRLGKDKDWMSIKGEQHFTFGSPGFIWIGKTKMFNAHDAFIQGKGNLSVYLFGLFKIVNESGKDVDKAEFIRWLGESVWMPANLLPDENKEWVAIDDNHADLIYSYSDQKINLRYTFNDKAEIVSIKCKRPKGDEGLQDWEGMLSDYKRVDKYLIPHKIKAAWIDDDGEKYIYADFDLESLKYK